MNPDEAEYGQAMREAFVLGQAIDDTSRDILMADPQPFGNYAEATALFYTAYAQTLDSLHTQRPDEVQEVAPAYDARVFQLIQALEYAPPYMSPETDPDFRETALRAALSEAFRQAIERVTQVQLQAQSEESIILAMRLAQRMADISNAIVDYGLTESDYELHRFIALSLSNVRDLLHPEEEADDESRWTMPQPDPMFTYVDLDYPTWAVGGTPRLAIDRPGGKADPEPPVIVVEQGADVDEVLPDTNWSAEQLEHLRSVINAVLKRVVIKEGDEVVYDGPYPQKPFELNPTLTRAIMEKLGFSLDVLGLFQQQSPSDPRFVPLTFERQLKQWLDQVDDHYQNEDFDRVNFVAAIRTQAKSAVFNAISGANSPSHTKGQLKQARTKSIDRLILDLNARVRALKESQ